MNRINTIVNQIERIFLKLKKKKKVKGYKECEKMENTDFYEVIINLLLYIDLTKKY